MFPLKKNFLPDKKPLCSDELHSKFQNRKGVGLICLVFLSRRKPFPDCITEWLPGNPRHRGLRRKSRLTLLQGSKTMKAILHSIIRTPIPVTHICVWECGGHASAVPPSNTACQFRSQWEWQAFHATIRVLTLQSRKINAELVSPNILGHFRQWPTSA